MQLGGFGMTEHYVAMHDAGYHYAELTCQNLKQWMKMILCGFRT